MPPLPRNAARTAPPGAIRAARESAAAYFAAHAQVGPPAPLLSPDGPVEAALAAALGDHLGVLLDIGTGTGRMVELFAPRASRHRAGQAPTCCIARSRLQHLPAGLVDLVQGDFAALPLGDASADTVLLHQVLHYAQAPEAVLAEAARVARPGARLAVVDLAAHEHEDLRATHAHARLGFSDEQMAQLFSGAGFAADPPSRWPAASLPSRSGPGAASTAIRPPRTRIDPMTVPPPAAALPGDLSISFEFFPPKSERWKSNCGARSRRWPRSPSFVSVTYGAGGTTRERTHATVARILKDTDLTPAAHLTCVAASKGDRRDCRPVLGSGRAPYRGAARRSAAGRWRALCAPSARLCQRRRTGGGAGARGMFRDFGGGLSRGPPRSDQRRRPTLII
jgi:SAM-dependent methyltransferase